MTILGGTCRNSLARQHAGLECVEQPAVGQVERHADRGAEHFGRLLRFGQANLRPGRQGRRLAIGQIDDADRVALLDELGQRPAAGDFDIVGMGADGDDIKLGPLVRVSLIGYRVPRLRAAWIGTSFDTEVNRGNDGGACGRHGAVASGSQPITSLRFGSIGSTEHERE